jgi:YesN/AraC family two-component response regulator
MEKRKKESIPCAPGLLLLYPAHELHRNTDYVSNSESFSIEFENDWCEKFEINNQESNTSNIINNPIVKHKIVEIMREVKELDDQSSLSLETTILDILSSLTHDKTENKRPSWITHLYELLHDESNTNWSLALLSEKLNVHPVTISKYFPKYFQTNIGDYIRKIKTEKSLTDLSKKSIALEEIAVKYGFVDNAHFTRVFKKHTGITPSQYRQFIAG